MSARSQARVAGMLRALALEMREPVTAAARARVLAATLHGGFAHVAVWGTRPLSVRERAALRERLGAA